MKNKNMKNRLIVYQERIARVREKNIECLAPDKHHGSNNNNVLSEGDS